MTWPPLQDAMESDHSGAFTMREAHKVFCLLAIGAFLISAVRRGAAEQTQNEPCSAPEAPPACEEAKPPAVLLLPLSRQPDPTLAVTGRMFPACLGRSYGSLWADLPFGRVGSLGYRYVGMQGDDIEEVYLATAIYAEAVKRERGVGGSPEQVRALWEEILEHQPAEVREEAKNGPLPELFGGRASRHVEYVEFGRVRAGGGEWLPAVGLRVEDEDWHYVRCEDKSGFYSGIIDRENRQVLGWWRGRNINRVLIIFDSQRPVVEFQHRWLGAHLAFEWGVSFSGERPLRRGYYQGYGFSVRF